MPQIFRVGPYSIYFWSNENNPLEPIHVHIAEGKATANATKVWKYIDKEMILYILFGRWICVIKDDYEKLLIKMIKVE